MTSPRLSRFLFAALVLALAAPAQAQHREGHSHDGRNRDDRSEDRRYERDFDLDHHNARTYRLDQRFEALGGQDFNIRGDLRVALDVRGTRDGDARVTGTATGSGLVVTRLRDGETFQLVGAQQVEEVVPDFRSRDSSTFRTVLDFRASSRDADPDYRVLLTLSGRLFRDGVVRGEVTDIRLERR
jgi:hypothetical protein